MGCCEISAPGGLAQQYLLWNLSFLQCILLVQNSRFKQQEQSFFMFFYFMFLKPSSTQTYGVWSLNNQTLYTQEIATLLLWHDNRSKSCQSDWWTWTEHSSCLHNKQSVWDLSWCHGGAKWKPAAPPSFGSQVHCVDNTGYRRKPLYYGCLYFCSHVRPSVLFVVRDFITKCKT